MTTSDDAAAAAQRRLLEKRESLGIATKPVPVQPTISALATLADGRVEGTCACGVVVSLAVPTVDGRPLPFVRSWIPVCPDCRAKQDAAEQAREDERRRALAARRRAFLLDELNVPELYAGVTLDNFVTHGHSKDRVLQQEALHLARGIVAAWPRVGLFYAFLGVPGSGKGHIAYSLCKALVEAHGAHARFIEFSRLLRDLRASWGVKDYEGPTDDERVAKWVGLDFLVIDEVSKDAILGSNSHQQLFEIVNLRINAGRTTILTSNATEAELPGLLRPALLNRLEGNGGIVDFGESSYRTKGGA